jgi:hypothetical protein
LRGGGSIHIRVLPEERMSEMTKRSRFAFFAIALAVLAASAGSAYALEITVSNDGGIGTGASVAFAYTDASTGRVTAKGWFSVPAGEVESFQVNADPSHEIYFAAYNKVPFLDSATRGKKPLKRWASPHNFTFDTDDEPDDDGAWEAKFYPVGHESDAYVVNLDYAPHGK